MAFVGVKLGLLSVPPYLHVVGLQKAEPIKIDTTTSLLVVVGTLALATALIPRVGKPPVVQNKKLIPKPVKKLLAS